MDSEVRAVNEYLSSLSFYCDCPIEELAELGATYVNTDPTFSLVRLERVFCHGSLETGGRLNGGWWLNVPKTTRPYWRLEGQPVVSVDYKAFVPNAIYHQFGLRYDGDPYNIPSAMERLEGLGFTPSQARGAIKFLMNVMLNTPPNKGIKPVLSPTDDIKEEGRPLARQHQTALQNDITEHHPILAEHVKTGVGVIFQRLESDILIDTLLLAKETGLPIIPLHDACFTVANRQEELSEIMIQTYSERMGLRPDCSIENYNDQTRKCGLSNDETKRIIN